MTPDRTSRNERPEAPHQRPYDEQEAADRVLESKEKPPIEDPNRDPHAALNTPIGEPDPAATTDPYETDPQAQGDVPAPGQFPGPGPEPEDE